MTTNQKHEREKEKEREKGNFTMIK